VADLTGALTDQVSAWATLGAVLVALGVSLFPVGWRWLKRPRLVWTVGRTEPHRITTWSKGQVDGASLRVKVTNEPGRRGTRAAENVRAQLETVWVRAPQEQKQWTKLEFDITSLTWSSRRAELSNLTAQQITVIASGSTDYSEFVHWDSKAHCLIVYGARTDDQLALQGLGPGEFCFRIVLTASGLKPEIAHVKVTTESETVTDVARSEPPGPGEVQSMGPYTPLDSHDNLPPVS
jgi:hypothetical protein